MLWSSPVNAHGCCVGMGHSSGRTVLRRTKSAAGWGTPALLLVLMPKCPMCVVAYLAMATGVAVSVGEAEWIRLGLVALCAGILTLLAARVVLNLRCGRRATDKA